MPMVYQPPNFQLFDKKGNLKQHVAYFLKTCNNAGMKSDFEGICFVLVHRPYIQVH